jgi:hypothetical protein
MSKTAPTMKEMRAFKIGARARKFALEGCVIDGYELLFTALAEAKAEDPELHVLLTRELEKYEQRIVSFEAEEDRETGDLPAA